jgi:hypothetical protein
VKGLPVATLHLKEPDEAGHEIVVRCHGSEPGIVEVLTDPF